VPDFRDEPLVVDLPLEVTGLNYHVIGGFGDLQLVAEAHRVERCGAY
jgi:hypothetical protein